MIALALCPARLHPPPGSHSFAPELPKMNLLIASRIPEETLHAVSNGCVLTIGNFDGVHIGHQRLLEAVRTEADARGLPAVAMTFEPHPVSVFRNRDAEEFRLTPASERERILLRYGIDHVLTLHFDREFSSLEPAMFVQALLHDALKARSVHVGYDFNFGRKRAGNFDTLESLGSSLGMTARRHAAVELDGTPVSSTRVREAVSAANMQEAARLLGRPFGMEGLSAAGAGRGSKIGIPTINLYPSARLVPRFGVYGSFVYVRDERYASITNIGQRPTFDDDDRVSVETMILEAFSGDAHNEVVRVELLGFIRPEMKFDGPDSLKAQISADVDQARQQHESAS